MEKKTKKKDQTIRENYTSFIFIYSSEIPDVFYRAAKISFPVRTKSLFLSSHLLNAGNFAWWTSHGLRFSNICGYSILLYNSFYLLSSTHINDINVHLLGIFCKPTTCHWCFLLILCKFPLPTHSWLFITCKNYDHVCDSHNFCYKCEW